VDADAIIAELSLTPHPEGGWFRETFRDATPDGGRGALTQIYYLLRRGECSRWHRIDAVEVWHFYAGDPLVLRLAAEGSAGRTVILGTDFSRGQVAHAVVPAHAWQAAASQGRFSLVGCTVAPAFCFEGFELAPEQWEPPG
jgi:predicted cupin superfamily sugar epimerase